MPLSKSTQSLRFMNRQGDAQPTPAITKSKMSRAAPKEPVASTSSIVEESAAPVATSTGRVIQRETSMLAFPMLSSTLLGASSAEFAGPSAGRRSFGHFNKAIESLHKPLVAPSKGEEVATVSSDSEPSSEEESDSSLELIEQPVAKTQKRPHQDKSVQGFLKPKLGDSPHKEKKRRRD